MKYDLPLEQLIDYRPQIELPSDFDQFWQGQKQSVDALPLNAVFRPVVSPFRLIEINEMSFVGYGGAEIKGWLLLPDGASDPQPGILVFRGYGEGRGSPLEHILWASAGYPTFVMDTRGQGALWSQGDTPDADDTGSPSVPGFVTKGLLDPASYYYLRVFVDAYRAVAVAREHGSVSDERLVVAGASQGGLLALAAASLSSDVAAALIDVPFLCHVQRALDVTDSDPYAELSAFLRARPDDFDTTFRTLSYFDGVNHARRCSASALFSVGLEDVVCPPSTVFGAHNHYLGDAEIKVYPFGKHEVLPPHREVQLDWLAKTLS